jgi:hypothetical protein
MRRYLLPAVAGLLITGSFVTTTGAASATPSAVAAPATAAAAVPAGLPDGVPAAATRAEPSLPKPKGWPFAESFPRTSGTGRLGGGAAFWSDYVYDDHGANGGANVTQPAPIASLAPTDGTYSYPAGAAHMNGADIFRTAVGLDSTASYWRIDWNTLVDPKVPIAEWTFDTDHNAATGSSVWPAGAGVRSAGVDRALVVSSQGARILSGSGAVLATLPKTAVTVDTNSRSFVVKVPRAVLPVTGTWNVRLAAGLADATGTAFAPVPASRGALPGQPSVYNVTFRSVAQEPPVSGSEPPIPAGAGGGLLRAVKYGNFWNEDGQAAALSKGDVSAFTMPLDWAALTAKKATPEPRPTGWSNRWYVSSLNLGQGVVANPTSSPQGDLRPNFLGRIQPYGVYVPTTYDPSKPTPLTWVLHSLGVNQNQYSALGPKFLQGLCEQRKSICATTLGYGPDGWYYDEAENDFWSVWRSIGQAYRLDPERTVMSGYSMGGFASYKLGLSYPDLFAKSMPLAGPPQCGVGSGVDGVVAPAGPGRCTTDNTTGPLVGNARYLPYVMADGLVDELVPYTSVVNQIAKFRAAGLRFHFESYPTEDHLVYATQDGFSSEVAQIGNPTRVRNPQTVDYHWYPNLSRSDLGLGTTGDYWVRQPIARNATAGSLASVLATSGMRPEPTHTVSDHLSYNVPGDPSPAVVEDQTWNSGPTPAAKPLLTLKTANVLSLSVDMARAGFRPGQVSSVSATTDGPTTLRLTHLAPGARVRIGATTLHADSTGAVSVPLPAGASTVLIG